MSESFIDAFYSFDQMRLESFLNNAQDSLPSILYYQGWAEGGNYKVLDRKPCVALESDIVECSITVEDDPIMALGIDFKVTDTFQISFENGEIAAVETSSNDPQIYYDARDWVRANLPDLLDIPCQGFFSGGPTPGDCARAMTQGYGQFAASDDFPTQ
ncbi:MAG: hypothetical protein GKR91_20670 [Pseudomonadales bacterium]|nr:hypothetical protein [Pseudomonadales bacterium]